MQSVRILTRSLFYYLSHLTKQKRKEILFKRNENFKIYRKSELM
jgi:hypothetical protein